MVKKKKKPGLCNEGTAKTFWDHFVCCIPYYSHWLIDWFPNCISNYFSERPEVLAYSVLTQLHVHRSHDCLSVLRVKIFPLTTQ